MSNKYGIIFNTEYGYVHTTDGTPFKIINSDAKIALFEITVETSEQKVYGFLYKFINCEADGGVIHSFNAVDWGPKNRHFISTVELNSIYYKTVKRLASRDRMSLMYFGARNEG